MYVESIRGSVVESRHTVHVAVVDTAGKLVARTGNPDLATFWRSAAKPFQAMPLLDDGVVDRFGLTRQDLALACASHSSEPAHVALVRDFLQRVGCSERDLMCGPHRPLSDAVAKDYETRGVRLTAIHSNCSGKHTGMLLTCLAAGWPGEGYWVPEHPLQRHLGAVVEELCGERAEAVGVDGCGAALFSMSLAALASGFLRLVTAGQSTLERTVADAMRAYPHLVGGAGPEREDSRLMAGVPGLLAKGGAEGVLAVALPGMGAVALKVDDGAKRPVGAVAVAVLRRLGVRAPVLDELASPRVLGGGEPVGEVRVVG